MADSTRHDPPRYDGRFGERFDDELSVSGVVWTGVAILVACVLGIGITLWVWKSDFGAVPARDVSPLPQATERQKPPGPLLQASPEAELEAMRADMRSHLEGYAWVDRDAGVARIPIDLALDALAAVGVETELAGPALEGADRDASSPHPTEESPEGAAAAPVSAAEGSADQE